MNWIQCLKSPGHLSDALIHLNHTIERIDFGLLVVDAARFLFDALNKVQSEWVLLKDMGEIGEVKAFQSMILDVLSGENHVDFLHTKEVSRLVYFEPEIMNHYTLRRHRYRPDQDIDASLIKKATLEHRKVVTAFEAFHSKKNDEEKGRISKRLAELLYIVRSNIAHGEKTPYGPDFKKIERDREVCKVVVPIQRLLLNVLLDFPERKLVTYGTLIPGGPNHHIISDIPGIWEDCEVRGVIKEINGLKFFDWQPGGSPQNAKMFISNQLAGRWDQVDRFEGIDYRRILVPVSTKDGIAIANCYVAAQKEAM